MASLGRAELAGFPGLVPRAEGGGNVLGELRAGGGVDGIGEGKLFNEYERAFGAKPRNRPSESRRIHAGPVCRSDRRAYRQLHVPAGANFECHINLSELGKILLCEVLNFGGGRLLLDNTLLDGLCRGLAFLATLLGMAEKTSAL
jgi:hypothetical protein